MLHYPFYKVIATAADGFYLGTDAYGNPRPRPPFKADGVTPTLPPNTEVCLVEATTVRHGYHSLGDRWVEYFEIPTTKKSRK